MLALVSVRISHSLLTYFLPERMVYGMVLPNKTFYYPPAFDVQVTFRFHHLVEIADQFIVLYLVKELLFDLSCSGLVKDHWEVEFVLKLFALLPVQSILYYQPNIKVISPLRIFVIVFVNGFRVHSLPEDYI